MQFYFNRVYHLCLDLIVVYHVETKNLKPLYAQAPEKRKTNLSTTRLQTDFFLKKDLNNHAFFCNFFRYIIMQTQCTCTSVSPSEAVAMVFDPVSSSDDSVIGSSCLPLVELKTVSIDEITEPNVTSINRNYNNKFQALLHLYRWQIACLFRSLP